jgi:hypothetical protein|tara:strand:+ start:1563 stop:2219 length:657 start_codon:yes stop_codon:yes gene_type:complete
MGFLNNTAVTLDAILTRKGRELLARGDGTFKITQFALSDDEIDYTLYNPNHPSGSGFYGEAIDNMPLLEAFPDETQVMKYKLVTLPRGTARMPVLDIGYSSISFKQGTAFSIRPQTLNYLSQTQAYETSGYTFTISDVRLLNNFNGVGVDTPEVQALNSTTTIGTSVSKTVVGTSLSMTATTINTLFGGNTALTATLQIVGRDSGARVSIPITINKVN